MVKIATFAAAALLVAPAVIAAPNPAGPLAQQEELVARALLELYVRDMGEAGVVARDFELDERGFGGFLKKVGGTALSILKREQDMDMYERDFDELEERKFNIGNVFKKIGSTALSILKRQEDDMYERDFDELEERKFNIGNVFKKIGSTALSILKREEDMDMYERDFDGLDELD